MKHTITHLKAPWPSGAKVGDVIQLDHVPAWAVGKCKPAAEDAEVTVSAGAPEAPVIVANVVPEADAAALEAEAKAKAEAEAEAAKAAEAKRAALEAEAKAMHVSFNARTSDETLAERIAEAKKA